MEIKKLVREGEQLPKYYGVAYYEDYARVAVCYPLFINIVVYYWHEFIYKVSSFGKPDKAFLEYQRGRSDGYLERIMHEERARGSRLND